MGRRHMSIRGLQGLMVLAVLVSSVSAGTELKNTIKTIEAEGVLIDCIDIYKQPAFDHPILNNHTIQLKPSFYLEEVFHSDEETRSQDSPFHQDWTKFGQCPDGTIPVLRNSPTQGLPSPGDDFLQDILGRNRSSRMNDQPLSPTHEFAMTYLEKGDFYGERALLNLWNPRVSADKEMSISSARLISSGGGDNVDRIEAGWMVTSTGPFANRPVFYIYWTAHGSKQIRGCFNLDCPGFVKVDKNYVLGHELNPVSWYGGKQYEIEVTIVKDQFTGHWWVKTFGIHWGYWPNELFTNLNKKADFIFWGGEVINSYPLGSHTKTQMGSGFFPRRGYEQASFTRDLGYYTADQTLVRLENPDKLLPFVTKHKCYAIDIVKNTKTLLGLHFFFGGPGFSDICHV